MTLTWCSPQTPVPSGSRRGPRQWARHPGLLALPLRGRSAIPTTARCYHRWRSVSAAAPITRLPRTTTTSGFVDWQAKTSPFDPAIATSTITMEYFVQFNPQGSKALWYVSTQSEFDFTRLTVNLGTDPTTTAMAGPTMPMSKQTGRQSSIAGAATEPAPCSQPFRPWPTTDGRLRRRSARWAVRVRHL